MRIELPILEHYGFSTQTIIRVDDLNYADHLSNDRVLTYAHQARVELLASWGYKELEMEGIGIIMTDAAVVYKAQGHLGDPLTIEVGVADVSKIGFDLHYKLTNQRSQKVLALVKTGILCFDYKKQRIASIPQAVLSKIEAL